MPKMRKLKQKILTHAFVQIATWTLFTGVIFAHPSIEDIRIITEPGEIYEKFEVAFQVKGEFRNPFDPDQIQIDGHFLSPDGKQLIVPAFYYQDFQRTAADGGKEVLKKIGEPNWRIRFTPRMQGTWLLRICVRGEEGIVYSDAMNFSVKSSDAKGFIRKKPNTNYFSYENDSPYFPIGENMAWPIRNGIADYDVWLTAAGKSGMNLARIWLQWNNTLQIEHEGTGPGRYDLANAWRMDYVLDAARGNGVRVFFTIDSPELYQKELRRASGVKRPWVNCPYNIENGGPLRDPTDLFTSPEGKRLTRQRLRYIVGRWGWDPNIFCWELWNELNTFQGFENIIPQVKQWHVEMIDFLRQTDINNHLISTSFANIEGSEEIWELEGIDFTQYHVYRGFDMAGLLPSISKHMINKYKKPHIIGEFGPAIHLLEKLFEIDPRGDHIRNAIWSSALSGGSGTALAWCWDNYIHKNNLYYLYASLSKFLQDIPWNTADFKTIQTELSWTHQGKKQNLRDLILTSYDNKKISGEIILDPTARSSSFGPLYIHGKTHPNEQKPITLKLNRTLPGPLILHVNHVWDYAALQIKLDGSVVYSNSFHARPGKGSSVRSQYDARWGIWGADYDVNVAIHIPEGAHTVELYNTGQDRLTIDRIDLPNYLIDHEPNIRAIGLIGEGLAILWIQNSDHNLAAVMGKRSVKPVTEVKLILKDFPSATVKAQWWDTTKGVATKTEEIQSTQSGLVLELPPVQSDIACKITWN
jgi:hypothetical protein